MNKLYVFAGLLITGLSAQAQALFNNNGADIYVKDGAFMIVKTNSVYNTQLAGSGLINNEGTIVIEGDITNDGSIIAAGDTIRLSGNWINNNAYNGNSSWVEMNGGAQQITGTAVTVFNNLNLLGGATVKRQTINSEVTGVLALNDAELATDVNEMYVSNTSVSAITRNSGFVSSLGAGRLSRATNSTSAYLYPVGSPSYNNPPSLFRPLQVLPATSGANVYGTALVKGDATNDGYNVNTLDNLLCKVNPTFYHRVYQSSGSDAAGITMFFDATADGDWTDEAHWDSPNQWNNLGTATAGNGLGFSTVTVNGVNDFTPEPFALARKKFAVNAGPDVQITVGQATDFNPVVTAASVASYDWTPAFSLSCSDCENPTASPTVTTQYTLVVTDDAGCEVADSLVVTVVSPDLLIPTGFSPNGDGVNDLFRVLNKDLVRVNLQVFNRWGEKVYETSNPLDGWDGIYKGVEQEMGTYVWKCEYQLTGQPKPKTAKGNVTLLR